MVAKTLFGFEELLAKELTQLGAQKVEQGVRVVSFMGDKGFMYKANLSLRTALKILKPIKTFKAVNDVALYKGIQTIDWSDYFSAHQSFLIDTTLHSDHFNHSQYVALKSKDAIVDQFRDNQGKRPNVDKDFPDLRIHVHIDRDQVTVSLDTSGESLHRRGYKTATNIAPINEVLAAGMLMLSGWDGTSHFIDPMCGSGTTAVECTLNKRLCEVFDVNPMTLVTYVREKKIQTVLDFAFQRTATQFASGYSDASVLATLFDVDDQYTTSTSTASNLVTFLGNHDMGRVGFLIPQTQAQAKNEP